MRNIIVQNKGGTEVTCIDKNNFRENIEHGESQFRIEHRIGKFSAVYPELPIHWHPEIELIKIVRGTVKYMVNSEDYVLSTGDIICVQPYYLHSGVRVTNEVAVETYIFDLSFLTSSYEDICHQKYCVPLNRGSFYIPILLKEQESLCYVINDYLKRLSEILNVQEFGYELEAKAVCLLIMKELFNHGEKGKGEDFSNCDRLHQIIQYIQISYSENISVSTAAKECGLSTSYYMHYFKKQMGMTFSDYLNQYRIYQAGIMLRMGKEISIVAYDCGFNNLSYFYKQFRKFYRMTPKEYIKL